MGVLKFLNKNTKKTGLFNPYKNHVFFKTMDFWINEGLDQIEIHNEQRKKIILPYMKIKFKIFRDIMWEWINGEQCTDCTYCDGQATINYVINGIRQYEDEAKIKGIPNEFIVKFAQWHLPHIKIILTSLKDICASKFYKQNTKARKEAILESLHFAFTITVLDFEKIATMQDNFFEKVFLKIQFDEANKVKG